MPVDTARSVMESSPEEVFVMIASPACGAAPVLGRGGTLVETGPDYRPTLKLSLAARRSVHLPDEPAAHGMPLQTLARAGVARRLGAAWLLGVFKLGTYWTCYTWLPTFLRNEMHQNVARSLAWMLTAQAGQLAGMLAFGAVSDRVGRRPAFAAFSMLTACALAPLAFAWRDRDEYRIPAAEVARIDRANRSARLAALAHLGVVQ